MIELVTFLVGVLSATVTRTSKPSGGDDLDAVASMLIAETNFNRPKDEMAQIVFVAYNRSRKWGIPMSLVVDPAGLRSYRRASWNLGPKYRASFNAARSSVRWEPARDFARRALMGAYRNQGHTLFVHPGALSTAPCGGDRVPVETDYGTRCLPTWALNGTKVGGAVFA